MHGLTTAQLSLSYGADDLDGSVVEYRSRTTPTTSARRTR
jgi:hypothetical protein